MSLPSIPAAFFGIVLGTIGLGACWRQASTIWDAPTVIGEMLMAAGVAVWLVLIVLFVGKWVWHRDEAVAELRHPVQCCFIGLAPVSTLLVSIAVLPYGHTFAAILGLIGGIGQLLFAVYRTGQLWTGDRQPEATTPVLYLPSVAGSFVSAIAAAAFDLPDIAALAFGAGTLTWFALESIILNRLYVQSPLAAPLRPTLGIQIAPAFVGCSAYLSFTVGPVDMVAKGLFGYGVLQALILARMSHWISSQPFAPSYWAFTFGLTAMALDAMKFVQRGMDGIALPLAYVTFLIANISVGLIAVGTVWLVARGRMLPARASTSAHTP